jgi:hypothetical protein
MTRQEKIRKLGNAIRTYRGLYIKSKDGDIEKWINAPDKQAYARVISWLEKLNVSNTPSIQQTIDGFKTFEEMNTFLRTI